MIKQDFITQRQEFIKRLKEKRLKAVELGQEKRVERLTILIDYNIGLIKKLS